jgi:hypothetical protein
MTENFFKIICIVFGVIAIYYTIHLIPDRTERSLTAFNKEYQFNESINISEKFVTDFDSSYGIDMELINSNHHGIIDTVLPLEIDLKILENGKPVELYGDYKSGYLMVDGNAQLSSFLTKENTEYEIKLNLKDNNLNQKKIKLYIGVNVPGPSYDLMFESDFKWVSWTINGFIILIAVATGYYGFRKKASR